MKQEQADMISAGLTRISLGAQAIMDMATDISTENPELALQMVKQLRIIAAANTALAKIIDESIPEPNKCRE